MHQPMVRLKLRAPAGKMVLHRFAWSKNHVWECDTRENAGWRKQNIPSWVLSTTIIGSPMTGYEAHTKSFRQTLLSGRLAAFEPRRAKCLRLPGSRTFTLLTRS